MTWQVRTIILLRTEFVVELGTRSGLLDFYRYRLARHSHSNEPTSLPM